MGFQDLAELPMELLFLMDSFPSWILQLKWSLFFSTVTRRETQTLFWLTHIHTHHIHLSFTLIIYEHERLYWEIGEEEMEEEFTTVVV